jgi:hypothetical protein
LAFAALRPALVDDGEWRELEVVPVIEPSAGEIEEA